MRPLWQSEMKSNIIVTIQIYKIYNDGDNDNDGHEEQHWLLMC